MRDHDPKNLGPLRPEQRQPEKPASKQHVSFRMTRADLDAIPQYELPLPHADALAAGLLENYLVAALRRCNHEGYADVSTRF